MYASLSAEPGACLSFAGIPVLSIAIKEIHVKFNKHKEKGLQSMFFFTRCFRVLLDLVEKFISTFYDVRRKIVHAKNNASVFYFVNMSIKKNERKKEANNSTK